MDVLIGVDIGGSHVGVCCILPDGKSLAVVEGPVVDRSVSAVISLVSDLIIATLKSSFPSCQSAARVSVIGIGCPGQPKNGVVVAASNFPAWKDVPLVELVQQRYPGAFVCLLKDSDAALAGELWGEHKSQYEGVGNAAMITLGTGIGVSLLLKGEFYSGSNGLVEGGHMIVDSSSSARRCGCGQNGCAEVYASASNVVAIYKDASGDDRDIGASSVFELAATLLSEAPSPNALHAENAIAQAADVLAILCINICRMVDPQVLIFAGGMSKAEEKLLSRVRSGISARAWTCLPQNTPLVVASAEHAGSVGAAVFAHRLAQKRKETEPKRSSTKKDVHLLVSALSSILALSMWKFRVCANTRCPLFGGTAMVGLSAVAVYSAILSLFNRQKNC